MKIISLWRPWGLAVILGLKPIETRRHNRFRCLVGQRIGIHNTQKWDRNAQLTMAPYCDDIDADLLFEKVFHPPMAIIGTVYVAGFRDLAIYPNGKDERAALCRITYNRYGLLLTEPRKLARPIPTPGRQGIWEYEVKE